jgi:hypothetical protein
MLSLGLRGRRLSWMSTVMLGTFLSVTVMEKCLAQSASLRSGAALFRLDTKSRPELVEYVIKKGYDIAGRNLSKGTIDIIAHTPEEERELSQLFGSLSVSQVLNPSLAPDSDYKTPAEVEAILREFAQRYPNLMSLHSIGKSVEGRDIWAARVSHDSQVEDPSQPAKTKPAILFNALHHAREVMTTEVALDTLEQLLTRYDQDATITHWVDANQIWIVPMVNPDGSNKVWTRNSMWRKNTRGGHGVDINRNYPYLWNSCQGSSGSTSSETYRGPSAGSEPETQALMSLVQRIQPVFDISYHSYSEMVLFPYGCEGRRAEAAEIIEPLGRSIAAALPSDTGRGTYVAGTSWEILYSVDGSDMDWMYHDQHVIPYVIEVNADSEGFQPDYAWRDPTVEKMRAAWQMLLNRLDQSGIRGKVRDLSGKSSPDVVIEVQRLDQGLFVGKVQNKVKKDGSFHVVLNPGRYQVTFTSGASRVSKDVMIGASRVDFDVEL